MKLLKNLKNNSILSFLRKQESHNYLQKYTNIYKTEKSSVCKILRTQYANKMFNLKPITMTQLFITNRGKCCKNNTPRRTNKILKRNYALLTNLNFIKMNFSKKNHEHKIINIKSVSKK